MSPNTHILSHDRDRLPQLIAELALYPQEKWAEHLIGKGETTHGTNEVLWEIFREIDEARWLKETTIFLFGRTERLRQLTKSGATISEFAYLPIPGLKNGTRIKHPCETKNRLRTQAILTDAPGLRSRELAWLINYKTSIRETNFIAIFTYDPILEIIVRTNATEWEKCTTYWRQAIASQGILKTGERTSCIHAFTGLHEWMRIIETADGEDTPQSWQRHPVSATEANHAAEVGLDIYYSNSVVAHVWSTLEKQRGKERARALLQQNLCKKVILFDPLYGKNQGLKKEGKTAPPDFLDPGDTEREKTAKSFWEGTIVHAFESGASDIHIEPIQVVGKKGCDLIVSIRKDGQLNFHTRIPDDICQDFIRFALETSGVIKEENKRPQDGRRGWIHPKTGQTIDLRISVTPCGAPIQKIVMRLLDTTKLKRGIADIGLEDWEVQIWDKGLKLNQSLTLVSGPTNSGKCCRGTTLISTDKGIIPLAEIVKRHESGERFQTWNEVGWEPITNVFRSGRKEIIEVHTKSGTLLEVADTHPFLQLKNDLSTTWSRTKELSVEHTLLFQGHQPQNQTGNWEKYYLYGAWIGDGHASGKTQKSQSKGIRKKGSKHNGKHRITALGFTAGKDCLKTCPEYLSHLQKVAAKTFGGSPSWKPVNGNLRLTKGNRPAIENFLKEGVLEEKTFYSKRIPKSLWTATSFEIAGFFSGWIDTDGHCGHHQIEITTKERTLAQEGKYLLSTLGVRSFLSQKTIKGKTYWRVCIRGSKNISRLIKAGVAPVTTYKRDAMIQEKGIRKNDKVSFKIKRLGDLQNQISKAVQTAYGPLSREIHRKHLKLGPAFRKSIGVNTLTRIFELFPKALPLIPEIERLLKNELEPETVSKIVHTGIEEEMFDIEVGQNHTYCLNGIICHNSTTLYAALLTIFQRDNRRSFSTIEDPVEYRLPFRSTQSPVNEDVGATYEKLIRQAMRNDGDTFLIGEIRDEATASASLQLALTGHQVLSSIHANSATETALRLLELGVDPYILSETLKLVVSQRLVPTACPFCAKELPESEIKALLRRHGGEVLMETWDSKWRTKYRRGPKWVEGEGCPHCNFTGLLGMMAAQEFLIIDSKNKKALKEGHVDRLAASMVERSLPTMTETAWRLAWLGRTPIGQAGELTDQLKSY